MVSSRRGRRLKRLRNQRENAQEEIEEVEKSIATTEKKHYKNIFSKIYDQEYKKIVFIPILLLLFAFIVIGMNFASTGEFINKGVSLKGGITLTIPSEELIDLVALEEAILMQFPENDVVVRGISEFGTQLGVIVEIDISSDEREALISFMESETSISSELYSIEEVGSSLGESFFKQTIIAILLAFVFMGLVVFWYFRTFVPSAAVILAAFSDIVITLAIVDLMGMKISTAGIAAFLMLIGYSVDTDILLSTRVLKSTKGTVMDRIYSAMKTGLTMNVTTIIAIIVGLIVSDSEVIKQIMTIILIGLFVDIINTWLQNVAILRYYLEKKGMK